MTGVTETKKRVLVVEDEQDVATMIARFLSTEYDVVVASNGQQGLEMAFEEPRPELIILDDGGDFSSHAGDGWRLVSARERFPSLPDKFNALAELARGDILVVWEDDDIYLPWHLTAHAAALQTGGFSKPSRILANFEGPFVETDPGGSYHGSIAFTRAAFDAARGWPRTAEREG